MESTVTPYTAISGIEAESVLVLAPHPDDEVFGCGGALIGHVQAGCPVTVIVVSDGALGVDPNEMQDGRIEATREAESCAAAGLIGYPPPNFWRLADRSIAYSEALVVRVINAVRSSNADLVYAPALTEMHPDHRALAMVAVEAVRRLGQGVRLAMYEVGVPLSPNLLVDISAQADVKFQAMRCFVSQLKIQRYDEHILALNRFRTYTLPQRVKMAEAFRLHDGADLALSTLYVFESEYRRQTRLGLALVGQRDSPLISVIVRSMDGPTLGHTLDSLSMQTYPNIEVLVVNRRGSMHSPVGIQCGRFPLRVVNETGNALGCGAATNAGFHAAGGDLLAFLNDTDNLDADHFSSLVALIYANAPTTVVAYSGVRTYWKGEETQFVANELGVAELSAVNLLLGNCSSLQAVLFPKTLLARGVSFDETLGPHEDRDFCLQLSGFASFIYSDRVTATYVRNEQSGEAPTTRESLVTRPEDIIFFRKWSSRLSAETLTGMVAGYRNLEIAYQACSAQRIAEAEDHRRTLQSLAAVETALKKVAFNSQELEKSFTTSTSWRLTQPLRLISQKIRHFSSTLSNFRNG